MTNLSTVINTLNTNLTKREKLVVELLSQGYSSKQIAWHLKSSKNTVDNQRKNMLKKTNTKNVTELVAVAIRQNII